MCKDVCVVLPAAGSGVRIGHDTPKQYYTVLRKPVIYFTAEMFLKIPWIKQVVVVAPVGSMELMVQSLNSLCSFYGTKLKIVEGGDSRHKSISLGLASLTDVNPEIVVIHDGVRPFVPEYILGDVVNAAREFRSAGVVCPLISTVVAVDKNHFLDHSLDRGKFRASEMPQAFNYSVILDAYSKCSKYDMDHGTECLHIAQKYMGTKAKLIESDFHLWKITYEKDLFAAERIIKGNAMVGILNNSPEKEFIDQLKYSLSKTFTNVFEVTNDTFSIEHIVIIYVRKSLVDILENDIASIYADPKLCYNVLLIALNSIDENENFQLMQGKSRRLAECIKLKNLLFYCIATKSGSTSEVYEGVTEMASSLLLDCNKHLSGINLTTSDEKSISNQIWKSKNHK